MTIFKLVLLYVQLINIKLMAERQGFEPWVPLTVHTLSKRAP